MYEEISRTQVTKRLKVRNLDILLIYFMSAGFYLLATGSVMLSAYVFYLTIVVAVYVHAVALSFLRNKRSFLLELVDYDLNDIWLPFTIWGVGTFFLLFFFYKFTGTDIIWASVDEALYHLILVVPSETFIFVVFLPEIMPKYFGKVPGWFWGAGVMFALFHWTSYSSTSTGFELIVMMGFAGFMGLVFYWIYKAGDTNRKIYGISATMALHFVWNYVQLSANAINPLVI